ncbi:MAG: hypothetical protein Q8N23_14500 [Archangium sp.]|nr:hypothetical protein [Archangium sp.]MDP3576081.1 hypothetical protein [Archangium sp.]
MRSPLILIVACVLVLAGAFFASRTLVSDVPVPAPMVVTPTTLIPVEDNQPAPSLAMPSTGRQAVNRAEAEAAMLAPRQGPLQQVNAAPVMPRMVEPNAPPPAADVAPSPFTGESKELDYAEAMMAETNPGLERLQSAHEVFSRCVEQEPANQRCKAGLSASQQRLGGTVATERTPGMPTLQAIPPHTRPPSPLK